MGSCKSRLKIMTGVGSVWENVYAKKKTICEIISEKADKLSVGVVL